MQEQILDRIENKEDGTEALITPSTYPAGYPFRAILRDTDADKVIAIRFYKTQAEATENARGWVSGQRPRI